MAAAVAHTGQPLFASGERVCWIGDSITQSGLWHSHVSLFHRTRFPDVDCAWINCGLSGDSAAGAMRRFEWDIAPQRPTVAVLMFGMNDVARHLYGPDAADDIRLAQRRDAITAHERTMSALADRLVALGARLICVSPSIYDDTGRQQVANLVGVDRALATCGDAARALADRHGGGFIDLHTPMAACNAVLQQSDPNASIVGTDRVHPGPPGHLFMAYHVLRGLGATATVAAVGVRASDGRVLTQDNCSVTVDRHTATSVVLRYDAVSVPFPILNDAQAACAWVPIATDLSCETLRVTDLPAGRYTVSIDRAPVALASAAELAAGIDLGANPATPQYRQAVLVAELVCERHRLISQDLRTVAAIRHFLLERHQIASDDFDQAEALVGADLEKARASGNSFGIFQLSTFLRCHRRIAEIVEETARLERAEREAAAPYMRTITIAPSEV